MDKFVYNAINSYFHTLENTGYVKEKDVKSLLVLMFLYKMMYHDYRGYITNEDYSTITEALNCLYGSSCLIPYPDYQKMCTVKLGDMAEVLERVKNIENTKVVKADNDDIVEISPIIISSNNN